MDIEDKKFRALKERVLKRKFSVAKNQAHYRGQAWTLTYQQYCDLWESIPSSWMFSGQELGDYNLSRKDMDGGWTPENVHIIPRSEMFVNQGAYVRKVNARKRD